MPCVDVEAVDCDLTCGSVVSCTSLDAAEKKSVVKKECSAAASSLKLLIPEDNSESRLDNHEPRISPSKLEKKCLGLRASSPGKSQLNSDTLHSPSVLCFHTSELYPPSSYIYSGFHIIWNLCREEGSTWLQMLIKL